MSKSAPIFAPAAFLRSFFTRIIGRLAARKIAAGVYADAKEAAYLAFQDLRELDRHPQVRRELLTAMIKDSLDSPERLPPQEVDSLWLDEASHRAAQIGAGEVPLVSAEEVDRKAGALIRRA
jgi:Putative addiction module component